MAVSTLPDYLTRLDEAILRATTHDVTLRDVLACTMGASPALVAERLRKLGLDGQLKTSERLGRTGETKWNPELHPVGCEYYFTDESALQILDALSQEGNLETVLTMGAPTIAFIAGLRRIPTTLIDSNNLIEERFDPWPCSVQRRYMSLDENAHLPDRFSTVILDPPWYPADMSAWIIQAVSLLKPGGVVAFPLFRELTRPTAKREREEIIGLARAIGDIAIHDELVRYETPLFEREAYRCSGIAAPDLDGWRTADLAVIKWHGNPVASMLETSPWADPWATFVVAGQVIKLRHDNAGGDELLTPLNGCCGLTLPEVSRRDRRLNSIGVWTSRNRVAKVGDPERLFRILEQLQTVAEVDLADSIADAVSGTETERTLVNDLLDV